jgi:hypothetical protein
LWINEKSPREGSTRRRLFWDFGAGNPKGSEQLDGKVVECMEKVSDEQYRQSPEHRADPDVFFNEEPDAEFMPQAIARLCPENSNSLPSRKGRLVTVRPPLRI